MGNHYAIAFSDSEDLINQAEYEGEKDYEVPGELARLLQQEKEQFCLTRSCWILSIWGPRKTEKKSEWVPT